MEDQKLVKLSTVLRGSWGSMITTELGEISVSNTGDLDVTEDQAEHLLSNFPKVYYPKGDTAPELERKEFIDPATDKDVLDFARNHTRAKNEERMGAQPTIAKSSQLEAGKSELVGAAGEVISSKEEVKEESKKEEVKEESNDIQDSLRELSISEIKKLLKDEGLLTRSLGKINDKDKLVAEALKALK